MPGVAAFALTAEFQTLGPRASSYLHFRTIIRNSEMGKNPLLVFFRSSSMNLLEASV